MNEPKPPIPNWMCRYCFMPEHPSGTMCAQHPDLIQDAKPPLKSREWAEKMAAKEEGHDVSAGEPPMNSDHAPTAEQIADQVVTCLFTDGFGQQAERLVLMSCDRIDFGGWCRRAVADVIVQHLKIHAANLESELAIARDLIATMRARIEELEKASVDWQASFSRCIDNGTGFLARAEAAEAKLRTVSDALDKEPERWYSEMGNGFTYTRASVAARDARIRAILEGK